MYEYQITDKNSQQHSSFVLQTHISDGLVMFNEFYKYNEFADFILTKEDGVDVLLNDEKIILVKQDKNTIKSPIFSHYDFLHLFVLAKKRKN